MPDPGFDFTRGGIGAEPLPPIDFSAGFKYLQDQQALALKQAQHRRNLEQDTFDNEMAKERLTFDREKAQVAEELGREELAIAKSSAEGLRTHREYERGKEKVEGWWNRAFKTWGLLIETKRTADLGRWYESGGSSGRGGGRGGSYRNLPAHQRQQSSTGEMATGNLAMGLTTWGFDHPSPEESGYSTSVNTAISHIKQRSASQARKALQVINGLGGAWVHSKITTALEDRIDGAVAERVAAWDRPTDEIITNLFNPYEDEETGEWRPDPLKRFEELEDSWRQEAAETSTWELEEENKSKIINAAETSFERLQQVKEAYDYIAGEKIGKPVPDSLNDIAGKIFDKIYSRALQDDSLNDSGAPVVGASIKAGIIVQGLVKNGLKNSQAISDFVSIAVLNGQLDDPSIRKRNVENLLILSSVRDELFERNLTAAGAIFDAAITENPDLLWQLKAAETLQDLPEFNNMRFGEGGPDLSQRLSGMAVQMRLQHDQKTGEVTTTQAILDHVLIGNLTNEYGASGFSSTKEKKSLEPGRVTITKPGASYGNTMDVRPEVPPELMDDLRNLHAFHQAEGFSDDVESVYTRKKANAGTAAGRAVRDLMKIWGYETQGRGKRGRWVENPAHVRLQNIAAGAGKKLRPGAARVKVNAAIEKLAGGEGTKKFEGSSYRLEPALTETGEEGYLLMQESEDGRWIPTTIGGVDVYYTPSVEDLE